MRAISAAPDRAHALAAFHRWEARWQDTAPRAVRCLTVDLEELLTVFTCPPAHRITMRTTNVIERCFHEVRRRVLPMTPFANPASRDRIIFAIASRLIAECRKHFLSEFTQR